MNTSDKMTITTIIPPEFSSMHEITHLKTTATITIETSPIKTDPSDDPVSIFSNEDIFLFTGDGNNRFLEDLFKNNILSVDKNLNFGYENKLHNKKFKELEEFLNPPAPRAFLLFVRLGLVRRC